MATFTRGPYRFTRWVLAGGLLLVLLTAGCGGGGALALDPVASAADLTLGKGTGHFDITVTIDLPQVGRTTISGEGTFSDRAMELTTDSSGIGAGAPSSMELRMLYPVMYMHFEGLPSGAGLPNGKEWVKVDLERAMKKLGVDLGHLGGGQSPTQALTQLRGSKGTKKLGTATIDGVQTTHYRAKISIDDALARATPKERKAVQRMLREAKAQGVDVTPTSVDVWISNDGLVRRMTEKLGNSANVTMTFSDYGKPVHIEAPATDDTIDLSKLLLSG